MHLHKKSRFTLAIVCVALTSSVLAQQIPAKPGSVLRRVAEQPVSAPSPVTAASESTPALAPMVQNSTYIQPDFALNQVHPAMPAYLAAKRHEIPPELVINKPTTTYKRQVPAGLANGGQVTVLPVSRPEGAPAPKTGIRSAAEIQAERERTRALQASLPNMVDAQTDLIRQQQAAVPGELPSASKLKTLPTTGR